MSIREVVPTTQLILKPSVEFLAALLLVSMPVMAQKLVGVSGNLNTGPFPLLAIDPATGAQTTLASVPTCPIIRSSAFDSTTHRYFLAGNNCQTGASQIVAVDTKTGALISSVPDPSSVVLLQFDAPSTPSISRGGVVPVGSTVNTIQPGEWVSIYGANLASGTKAWSGDFPKSLLDVGVTINNKAAYLSYVSPGQINLQAPSDTATGTVSAVVTTLGGSATSTVILAQFAPSFLLLDTNYGGRFTTGGRP